MATVNILNPATVGVDMKTHPLFLGNKKLHAATNMVFEEGVFKTRPGIRYHRLGFSGQFQGACLFTPSLGISSQAFAQSVAGLVTAAGGVVRVNSTTGGEITCNPIVVDCREALSGEVTLFGAENYLIVQSTTSSTYWWNGKGPAVESAGMGNDPYWSDSPAPVISFVPVVPTANIPDCDRFPCEFDACTLEISDVTVVGPTSATFLVTNSGTAAATISSFIATPPSGVTFNPPTLTVQAGTDEVVTITSATRDLEALGIDIGLNNSCGSVVGFNVPPVPVEVSCVLEILSIFATAGSTATLSLRNSGTGPIAGITIVPAGSRVWSFSPSAPYTLAPDEVVEVGITDLTDDIQGVPFSVNSLCSGSPLEGIVPEADAPTCSLVLTGAYLTDEMHGGFTISNNGDAAASIAAIYPNSGSELVAITPFPVFSIDPDSSVEVEISSSEDIRNTSYWVVSSCPGSPQNIFLPAVV